MGGSCDNFSALFAFLRESLSGNDDDGGVGDGD